MGYLVLTDKSNKVVAKMRHRLCEPDPAVARALVEASYPGCEVYDQLTPAPKGSVIVTTYVSRSAAGVGRINSKFVQWAVA